jgi:sulfate adenylyltransferase small subunit
MPELFEVEHDFATANGSEAISAVKGLNHLQSLEAESIHILREDAAEFSHPVMLYSIGKDSSVMLRLAQNAFFPGKIPFPLLHIDTSYKFSDMITFRDSYARKIGAELLVHKNEEAIGNGANPFSLGTQKCCGLLKTKSLLDALTRGGFNAAFGGARRDEEKSRAKERIYSFRDARGQWDPKASGQNCGTYLTRASTKTKASEYFRYRIGQNLMFGYTSTLKISPLCRCISPGNAKWWCGTAR